MGTYLYEASTRDGQIVKGKLDVIDERQAVERIHEMGYFPIKIKRAEEEKSEVLERISELIRPGIGDKDLMTFTYQLGVLLDAGLTLDRSLIILSGLAEKKKLKDLINDLIHQIRSGKSFSDALSRHPHVFPLFYVNMVRAGETGGFLNETISRIAVHLENTHNIKEEVRSAMIYPLLLSIVGGSAIIILLTFVVPQFTKIFTEMGEALPLPTAILLGISSGLIKYWWMILLIIFIIVVLTKKFLESERGKRWWDDTKFRLPIFGKLFRETVVSRFARTLGALLESGVPLLNALQIVQGTLESDKMASLIASVRESVRKGRGISAPLSQSDIFPPIAVHMITVGEESGRLDEMFLKIADRFDNEIRMTIKRMLSLLEPALILIMGLVVGFIVISMLIAIFSINELPF